MSFKKIFKQLLLGFFIFFALSKIVFGQDFQADYEVYYYLNNNNPQTTQVSFKIKIKHLRSDIRLKKFTLSFSNYFSIDQISAFIENQKIDSQINTNNDLIVVTINIPDEFIFTKDSLYEISLNFNQKNLVNINGNVFELMIPTLNKNENNSNYKAVVILPQSFEKKISLAKPRPTYITGNQIIWENPQVKTIYAVFGEKQIYKSLIYYGLKNEKLVPIYTEVAFPPDTLYQQIFIEKIVPEPVEVYQDDDGNFLGKYLLKPKESLRILFEGKIIVYTQPREELKDLIKKNLEIQKHYLLNQTKDWQINNIDDFKDLKDISDIYYYIVNNFKYDYKRLTKRTTRLGADWVLKEKVGVCTEFTDSFVSLTREKGFFSREIQGYGFSSDPQLRPIVLSSDVLHSWPEFFDSKTNLWLPVDPTWENTSGIDYFHSFDLNHIAFVIHGKDSQYPVPAGAYKIQDSKDILIDVTSEEPDERKDFNILLKKIDNKLIAEKKNYLQMVLENKSNIYLYNQKVEIISQNNLIKIKPKIISFASLLPLEKKVIDYELTGKKINKKVEETLVVKINNQVYKKINIILLPKINEVVFIFLWINLVLIIFIVLVFYVRKKRR